MDRESLYISDRFGGGDAERIVEESRMDSGGRSPSMEVQVVRVLRPVSLPTKTQVFARTF
jgi:hypothetical protein